MFCIFENVICLTAECHEFSSWPAGNASCDWRTQLYEKAMPFPSPSTQDPDDLPIVSIVVPFLVRPIL